MPLLVKSFLSKFNKKLGKKIDRITPETMQQLENYQWPGNVREMQNIIERAAILSNSSVLTLDAGFQLAASLKTPAHPEGRRPVAPSKY